MLFNLLYMIKDLTKYIAPALSMKQPGRSRSNWNYSTAGPGSLVFHPKPISSALHILKCSLWYIVTVCIQLSAVKTFFFFWMQKSGFCPSFPKPRWWPTDSCWQKGQRFPLLPPHPDVIRPRTGDPSAAQKAQWEGSLLWTQLHDGHHTDTEQLVTSGHWDDPRESPVTAGSEAGVQGRAEPRREREAEPQQQGWEWAGLENGSQKQFLLLSFWEDNA